MQCTIWLALPCAHAMSHSMGTGQASSEEACMLIPSCDKSIALLHMQMDTLLGHCGEHGFTHALTM